MSAGRNKTPSDSETDFSDLNEILSDDPSPTKPFAEPGVAAPQAPAAGVVRGPSPGTVRPDIRRSVTPFGSPSRRPPAMPDREPPGSVFDNPLGNMSAPSRRPSRPPMPDRWSDDLSDAVDDLFGPAPSRASSLPPILDPPTGPPRTPTSPGMVAPPPPRMPAMGPAPDISFGIEPDTQATGAANDALGARGTTGTHRVEDDLSWNRGGNDFALPLGAVHPDDEDPFDRMPTTLPGATDDDSGDAYSLVHKASLSPPAVVAADPRREMNDRFALGDFSGALVIAEALLAEARGDAHVERIVGECRAKLEQMYASRLGALTGVPSVAVAPSELRWLSLDHRAGFVLSLVDGSSSIEEMIDIAGMPALEVLRVLYELHSQRVIEFKAARGARR